MNNPLEKSGRTQNNMANQPDYYLYKVDCPVGVYDAPIHTLSKIQQDGRKPAGEADLHRYVRQIPHDALCNIIAPDSVDDEGKVLMFARDYSITNSKFIWIKHEDAYVSSTQVLAISVVE